jgi:uncharacterized small protein (DUF1192 family)
VSTASQPPGREPPVSGRQSEEAVSLASAIAEVSERASLLVREEIELAKAEMTEKATKLAKGAVVGVVAGVFFVMALLFALVGCAWLLYFYLPIGNNFTFFWGFFAMAVILVVLGIGAGLIAARAVKRGSPPVPSQAIAQARMIREAVAADASSRTAGSSPVSAAWAPADAQESNP